MVFLFVLFGPALTVWFFTGKENLPERELIYDAPDSRVSIGLLSAGGVRRIAMEEYLYGVLPMVIPAQYEPECIKAQAILLRTNLIKKYMEQVKSGESILEDAAQSCLTAPQLKEMWGSSYYENSEKIRQAVNDTRGIYITYNGMPIESCYFRVSAGRTRDGEEVLGEEFPYLRSVACPKDYLSADYLTHITMKKKEVERLIGGEVTELQYDSAGYCTAVFLQETEGSPAGEHRKLSGEAFRELLHLSSASFTMEEEAGKFLFTVKGTGHGLGFCQYAANELAQGGYDYNSILSYFFQNIALDKYE